MNTMMWQHPLTRRHLRQLAIDAAGSEPPTLGEDELVEWINAHAKKLRIVGPISKRLACGDVGPGAMAEVDQNRRGGSKVVAEVVRLRIWPPRVRTLTSSATAWRVGARGRAGRRSGLSLR